MGAGVERECKIPLAGPADGLARLARAGAEPVRAAYLERNALYDTPDRQLTGRGQTVRLRTTPHGATLTFKGPSSFAGGIKARDEFQTGIDDPAACDRLLRSLGYVPWFRYEKRRATFRLAGCELALDEVPIGCFLEIEGEDEPIRAAAALLGLDLGSAVARSYTGLYLDLRAARPELPPDMAFPGTTG